MTYASVLDLTDELRHTQGLADRHGRARWVAKYIEPHLYNGSTVLDVGCGSGAIDATIARRNTHIDVIGIDRCPSEIDAARRALCECSNAAARIGDANGLPYADRTFNLVFRRLMLEYVPLTKLAVVEMVRVCKTGGQVVLQDLDSQFVWYEPYDKELESDMIAVMPALAQIGFDPFVGRKLYHLANSAGLVDIQVEAESHGLYTGSHNDDIYRLWEQELDIALPALSAAIGSYTAAEQINERILEYLRREDTMTYSVAFTVVGTKP